MDDLAAMILVPGLLTAVTLLVVACAAFLDDDHTRGGGGDAARPQVPLHRGRGERDGGALVVRQEQGGGDPRHRLTSSL